MPGIKEGGEGIDEVLRLRERLWRSRVRRTRYNGIAFLVVGSLSLILALVTHDLIFEIAFLLTVPIGILMMLMSVETYVRSGTANAILMSSLLGVKAFSSEFLKGDRFIFVPSKNGEVKLQVGFSEGSSNAPIALPELAKPLTHIYELEMGNLSGIDFQYLSRNLPKVIVDGLQLAEAVRIETDGDKISVTVERPVFWPLFFEDELKTVYEKIGCPLAWSLGESIAKCSGRPVSYLGYELSNTERFVRYKFELGSDTGVALTTGRS